METAPAKMSLAKLEVLVMPNGEIMCAGHSLGYVRDIGKYLSNIQEV